MFIFSLHILLFQADWFVSCRVLAMFVGYGGGDGKGLSSTVEDRPCVSV